MTLEDAYAAHRDWAVNVVKLWIRNSPVRDQTLADDIVQEAFVSLYKGRFRDVEFDRGLIVHAVKFQWNNFLTTRNRQKRDPERTRSINAIQEVNDDWDVACPGADTEASALARIELAESLGKLNEYQRRVVLTNALSPDGGKGIPRSTITSIQRRLRGKDKDKWVKKGRAA